MGSKLTSLKGMGVALVTPFRSDKTVDFIALERLIDRLLEGGADYILALGTTAETPVLSADERAKIRRFIADRCRGKIPVILGMGSNCTDALCREIVSTDLSDFEAILSITPYYNKPSQEGLYRHFAAVAEASPLPVILYNVPGRTGVNMKAETTLRLAHDFKGKIIGIKEASGIITQMDAIIKDKPKEFEVISGDDGLTYPLMTLGAVGVISVIGNAFPKEFSKMVHLCLEGRFGEALPIHHKFTELFGLLFVDGNPAGVKCALHALGLIENELRLPLVPTSLSTDKKIADSIESLTGK